MIRFVLPELVRGGFCPFGGHFTEQTAKGRFDRGIRRFGNPPIEQVVVLHPDEVMWLGHRLRALAEIFFEEFAKQFPFAPAEQGARLHRQFKAPFA